MRLVRMEFSDWLTTIAALEALAAMTSPTMSAKAQARADAIRSALKLPVKRNEAAWLAKIKPAKSNQPT